MGLLHLRFRGLDGLNQHVDLFLQLLLLATQALERRLGLLDGMVQVLHVVFVLVLRALAAVPVCNVLGLLLAEVRDHLINGNDHLVEMSAQLSLGGECREGWVLLAEVFENGNGLLAVLADGYSLDLHEGGGGVGEDLLGLRTVQDGLRSGDALELLGAEARARGPVCGQRLAGALRVLEEDLVGLELLFSIIAELLLSALVLSFSAWSVSCFCKVASKVA